MKANQSHWMRTWLVTRDRHVVMLSGSTAVYLILAVGTVVLGSANAVAHGDWRSLRGGWEVPVGWVFLVALPFALFALVAGVWVDHFTARWGFGVSATLYGAARWLLTGYAFLFSVVMFPGGEYEGGEQLIGLMFASALVVLDAAVWYLVARKVPGSFPPKREVDAAAAEPLAV